MQPMKVSFAGGCGCISPHLIDVFLEVLVITGDMTSFQNRFRQYTEVVSVPSLISGSGYLTGYSMNLSE
jgi:hypothetical protein